MINGKMKRMMWTAMAALLFLPAALLAQDGAEEAVQAVDAAAKLAGDINALAYAMDNLWLLIAAVLVFFMQAGFALVEAGLNAAKNTVNILFKNVMDANIGILLYFLVGYGIMYPGADFAGGYFGFAGFGVPTDAPEIAGGNLHPQVDFLF